MHGGSLTLKIKVSRTPKERSMSIVPQNRLMIPNCGRSVKFWNLADRPSPAAETSRLPASERARLETARDAGFSVVWSESAVARSSRTRTQVEDRYSYSYSFHERIARKNSSTSTANAEYEYDRETQAC